MKNLKLIISSDQIPAFFLSCLVANIGELWIAELFNTLSKIKILVILIMIQIMLIMLPFLVQGVFFTGPPP